MANEVERDDDALFVENGVPIKFCFHTSITQGRKAITRSIQRHGGQVVPSERDANVLLIDSQQDLALFRRRYYNSKEPYRLGLYVESRGFVQRCIRTSAYTHDKPVQHKMPGVPRGAVVGRVRVPFTEEDRENLVHYLATKLPTRDGRMGNKAYKELEEMGMSDDPAWTWVTRHTWHSWREHYKINAAMMDERIDAHVKLLENMGHHLGRDLRRRRQEEEEEEEEAEADGEEADDEEERQRVARQDHRGRPAPGAGKSRDQAPHGHLARHELDLVSSGDEGEEEPQHRERPEKRARSLEVSSVKAVRTPLREEDSSEDLGEDDDLFGGYSDENEAPFNYSNDDEVELPRPFTPSTDPVLGQNGAPPSTQATLIAQSPVADKERPVASSPMRAVETSVPEQTFPPTSQQTVVAVQQRVVSRSRVGASAQRAPSVPRETRTRSGTTAVDAPYRNTRARSRSVDPEPLLPLGRESRKGKGKEKATKVLPPIEDMLHEEVEEDIGFVTTADDGLSRHESLGDEQAVEELLEEAVFIRDIEVVQEVSIGEPSSDEDGDMDIGPRIESRHQDVDMDQPSDSDDAETHGSLLREAAGVASEEEQDENDMMRLQHTFPPPLQPRITRSKSRAQTVSPHRAQTGRVVSGPSTFPSRGRVQEAARKKRAV